MSCREEEDFIWSWINHEKRGIEVMIVTRQTTILLITRKKLD